MNSAVSSAVKVLLVTAVFTAAILLGGFYSAASSLVAQPGLIEGVSVDGIDVGGLSEEAARRAVLADWEQRALEISIPVTAGEATYAFTMEDAGARLVMDEAFERISRLRDGGVLDRLATRLEGRSGFSFETAIEFDEAALALAVEKFAQQVNVPPVNATVHFGDDGEFTFTDALPGQMLDEGELVRTLLAKYRAADYSPITVETVEVAPTLTKEELQEHTSKTGNTRTSTNGTPERLTNIRLSAEAVNGKIIMPGEVLSLNEATGERTAANGYCAAQTGPDGGTGSAMGGGVDQLAGTMYNAALLGELEIVERHQTAFPTDYLPTGLGAAVVWPDRDLKVRNNTAYPLYVQAQVEEDGLTVSFFGQMQTQGLRIELEYEVTDSIKPASPRVAYDDTKAAGYRKVVSAARDGSRVTTWRCYYDGDALVKREEIAEDRYEPVQGSVVIGSKVEIPQL